MKRERKILELLKKRAPLNVVLVGPGGLGKCDCARDLAASWLHATPDDLDVHPDFRFILPEKGYISSEKSEAIRNMAKYKTYEKSVCIVAQAHLMTAECQNKLLKVLEDGDRDLAVIFVSEAPLLDTVMSRCMEVVFRPLSDTALYDLCGLKERISIPALLACEGSVGRYYEIRQDESLLNCLESVFERLCLMKEEKETREILGLTHALKEKDREYFPVLFEEKQMTCFLCFIRKLFYYILLMENRAEVPSWLNLGRLPVIYGKEKAAAVYLTAERALVKQRKKGMFTKNDFFDLLLEMILCQERRLELRKGEDL